MLWSVPAQASKLKLIAPTITSFATDGVRYIAWEVPGQKLVFVLDTRTGHRRELKAPCVLKSKAPAAAARFLLECGEEERALLDVRTGAATPLPFVPPHPYANYGPIWQGVGSRYVIGTGGTSSRCRKRHRSEDCVALYDIATRAVTEVAESKVPDPDRPGAPPLCRALRSRVLKASKREAFEGLGPLAPLDGAYFGYSDGRMVEPEGFVAEREPDLVRDWVIASCKGPRTLVAIHAEPRNLEPFESPELNGDLLTWSTGHPASAYEAEEIAGPGHGNLRHGILGSYNLSTHKRRLWALPPLRLHVTRYLSGRGNANVVGTFGYSAHTNHPAFWIAARQASCTEDHGCPLENEVFALYSVHL